MQMNPYANGRSGIGLFHTLRQLLEKSWEHNVSINQIVVDFKKTHYSIDRESLFYAMEDVASGIEETYGFTKNVEGL